MSKFRTVCLIFILGLIGCGGNDAAPEATPTDEVFVIPQPTSEPVVTATALPTLPPPTATATAAPMTATPAPSATPEPTATPEPIVPLIEMPSTIVIDDSGEFVVDRVVSLEDGWLVVVSAESIITQVPIETGENSNVTITIDPLAASESMGVRLYTGNPASFSEESNELVETESGIVEAMFDVSLDFALPALAVSDQAVAEDGAMVIDTVVALADGWLAVYNDADGELGERVGIAYVEKGENRNVPIQINWRAAGLDLQAVLHVDDERIGRFDYPDSDAPVLVRNQPLQASVRVQLPPDVIVYHQPIANGRVSIDRVVSDGPAWLAILREDSEDVPGNIIGFAPLVDGVNEFVEVEVVPELATPILYVQLYSDTKDIGEFEFPSYDPAIWYDGQPKYFPFSTTTGNYVVSMDQVVPTGDATATVTVPVVVGDLPMWVAVRTDVEGALGDVLGYEYVPAGLTRNLEIEITTDALTDVLHVVLHIDQDEPEVFDFPDGRDFELQRRRQPIDAPFIVLNRR